MCQHNISMFCIKLVLLLICILAINDVSSYSTVQCDIFGICKVCIWPIYYVFEIKYLSNTYLVIILKIQDQVLQTITVRSKELCWLKCLKEDKCNWFSFEKASWTCNMFEICSELESNSTFTSGEKDCSYFNPLSNWKIIRKSIQSF